MIWTGCSGSGANSVELFALVGEQESHPLYQQLRASNAVRQHHFLHSVIETSLDIEYPMLSHVLIKAFNAHTVALLHETAGQYRTREVSVRDHQPPPPDRVPLFMDYFVNIVNWYWQSLEAIPLAAYALWRINYIHPFVNGNGGTARAICYFILCRKIGTLLPGDPIVPELLRMEPARTRYFAALRHADEGANANEPGHLLPLIDLIEDLLDQQLAGQDIERS